MGIKVAYYISPMIWAWRQGRVHQVGARADRMLCILPFEVPFYERFGVPAEYVGSPVLEQMPAPGPKEDFRRALGLSATAPTLALLPGSRMGELQRIGPTLAKAAARLRAKRPDLQLVVPVASSLSGQAVREALQAAGPATFVAGRAPEVVGASDVAVVASGTAALEAGLMERPMVVVYRMAPVSGVIAKLVLRVPHYSLVNLLAERQVVPELYQWNLTVPRLAEEVGRLFDSAEARDQMVAGLKEVRARLGQPGAASRVASAVLDLASRAMPARP
jgi:lipid-A-disaccharide synthase